MDFLKLQMKYVVGGGCQQHKETWWWNKTMDNPVKMKAWKRWRNGGSKEEYLKAKRVAKAAVYFSKKDAQAEQCAGINNNTDKNQIFKIAKRFKQDNRIVVGENCALNEEGKLILTMDSKLKAWQLDYKKLENVEFWWNASNLSVEPPVKGPAIKTTTEMVSKVVKAHSQV